ncbi:MAG TPA: hypothetical protein VFL59_04865 [Candidatus Nanopelagicales bacterium]|nr:hypothetical protein [Candidatus Nanopelagicales bacterium]
MGDTGLIVLVVMAIAIGAAWIGYAVASPAGRRRIEARREARSRAIIARSPGSAHEAASHRPTNGVSEDSAYGG